MSVVVSAARRSCTLARRHMRGVKHIARHTAAASGTTVATMMTAKLTPDDGCGAADGGSVECVGASVGFADGLTLVGALDGFDVDGARDGLFVGLDVTGKHTHTTLYVVRHTSLALST